MCQIHRAIQFSVDTMAGIDEFCPTIMLAFFFQVIKQNKYFYYSSWLTQNMNVDETFQAGEMYVENSLTDCSQLHRSIFKLVLNT